MKYSLILLFVAFAALAQEPPRHDQYRDDAHAYCWNMRTSGSQGAKRQQDPHGHECACHLLCSTTDGLVVGDTEDGSCELYCTRERCQCHIEEPCEMPK